MVSGACRCSRNGAKLYSVAISISVTSAKVPGTADRARTHARCGVAVAVMTDAAR